MFGVFSSLSFLGVSATLVTLLQGCLSGYVGLFVSISLRFLRVHFFCSRRGGRIVASSVRILGAILYPVMLSGVFHSFFRLLVSFVCFFFLLRCAVMVFLGLCRYRSGFVALTNLFIVVLAGFVISFGSTLLA